MDNWIWGLSLIVLTIAIHATGVTFMVSVLHNIRVRLEGRSLRSLHMLAIVIGAITAMGLLLAALHGIEAALWAAAYCGLARWDRLKLRSSTPLIRRPREALRGLCSNLTGR